VSVATIGALGDRSLWYLSRGTGAVSLVLLTVTLVLGIVDVRRWSSQSVPRFVIDGLHRTVSMLVLLTLAIHIVTSVLDPFAPIRLVDAIVPFGSGYRPVWLGLGAVAFDLLLALVITSLIRARIGQRGWRAVHWAAYACWPLALVHGLGTGSDVRDGFLLPLSLACAVAVGVHGSAPPPPST
jgi:sulfoxide reductase heme-binding subunit YedZ